MANDLSPQYHEIGMGEFQESGNSVSPTYAVPVATSTTSEPMPTVGLYSDPSVANTDYFTLESS